MKVLHLVSNISLRSGVMSVLMNYYRNIDTSEIQFSFMFFDERMDTYEDEINKLGGSVIKIPRVTHLKKFFCALNEFAENNYGMYEVLHIHELYMTGFFWKIKQKLGVKKIIVHSHASKFSEHRWGSVRNYLFAQANRVVPDYYFACSEIAGRKAFGKNFEKEGIIINNAIDITKFQFNSELRKSFRKELDIDDKFVVGHVGNFTPPKNHFFIIQVFEEILMRKQNAVLILVGDGYLRKEIFDLCKRKKIENKIIYLGVREDIYRIMQVFDRLLFPSKTEGLGIVLIEAQALGIPCIFSDVVPKEANILKDSNKILSLNKDVKYWAHAVVEDFEVDRSKVHKQIKIAGYDISVEAIKLQERYKSI